MSEIPDTCNGCQKPLEPEGKTISDGFIVCLCCGTAIDIYIEPTAEWRCYNQPNGTRDVTMVRCGNPVGENDIPSTKIEGSDSRQQRMHRWTTTSGRGRSLKNAHREFDTICRKYNLTTCIVKASDQLFTVLFDAMANKNRGVRRSNARALLKSACLYYACRQVGLPRDYKEIAVMYDTTVTTVSKGCKLFAEIVGDQFLKMKQLTAIDFLPRFCQNLQIEYSLQNLLSKIIQEALDDGIGREISAINMAGGAILWLCQAKSLSLTKEQVWLACGCSKVISYKTCDAIWKWHRNHNGLH